MEIFKKLTKSISKEDRNSWNKEETERGNQIPLDPKSLDVDSVINTLVKGKRKGGEIVYVNLPPRIITSLCYLSSDIFLSQPSFLELLPPIAVVGDIHGQYQDLLRWFDIIGYPPRTYYLFLGDYVDRGDQSIETICLLLAYKIKYPEIFFMLRGNHECSTLNLVYGFHDECIKRYDKHVWKQFTNTFDCLPVAALIDDKIFCCHGGISPTLTKFDQIQSIERPMDVPESGIVCDLLWADPDPYRDGYFDSERGVSYSFGKQVFKKFMKHHGLDLLCRAHQVVEDGYELLFDRQLVTIFSAPNYCNEFDNAGGLMHIDENLICTFRILEPKPWPTKQTKKRK